MRRNLLAFQKDGGEIVTFKTDACLRRSVGAAGPSSIQAFTDRIVPDGCLSLGVSLDSRIRGRIRSIVRIPV